MRKFHFDVTEAAVRAYFTRADPERGAIDYVQLYSLEQSGLWLLEGGCQHNGRRFRETFFSGAYLDVVCKALAHPNYWAQHHLNCSPARLASLVHDSNNGRVIRINPQPVIIASSQVSLLSLSETTRKDLDHLIRAQRSAQLCGNS